jgi:hypothetical protein
LLSSLEPNDTSRVGECARKLLTWNS